MLICVIVHYTVYGCEISRATMPCLGVGPVLGSSGPLMGGGPVVRVGPL